MKKALYFLLAAICLSVVLNIWQCSRQMEESTVVEHDTVWRDTTIYKPLPTESKETGETIYVKVPAGGDTLGTVPLCQQEPTQQGQSPCVTNGSDSVAVALEVVQNRYDDSLYTAWVSGYRPRLDSIRLHLPEITTTVTKTVVRSPLVTFGIQVGGGIGVFSRQPDIYVGVGGQLNFFRK